MARVIYFWKSDEDNGFLGNWYNSPFIKDGRHFINNEQYFMWQKQQLFDPTNISLEKRILETDDPKTMKDSGRMVRNFDQKVWDEQKYDIMKAGLIEKFSQNPDLKKLLLDTGDAMLVEASPYDRIWGIGINVTDASNNKSWMGKNLLGKALSEVRYILSGPTIKDVQL